MDLIRVFIHHSKGNIDEMFRWCGDNMITCDKVESLREPNTFSRPILIGFNFCFENVEDAIAFKLRWL